MKQIMKATIKSVLTLTVVSSLCKCADTYSWQDRVEPRTFINDIKDKFSVEDSIKTHFKTGNGTPKNYPFTLTATSDIPKTLFVSKVSGGTLKIDDQVVVTGSEIPLNKDKMSVKCIFEPVEEVDAVYDLEFRMKDLGGWVGNPTSIKIRAFRNLLPVARFAIAKTTGNNRYTFDASVSYDRDQRIGGGIRTFTYTITGAENRTLLITKPVFTYGFPIKGNYHVTLVVRDGDAGDSEPISTDVIVN